MLFDEGPIMPTHKEFKARQLIKGKHGNLRLVLTEDVMHLGKQGDLVEVRPGYGRNYLVPLGLATIPTEHNLKLLERYKERVEQAREAKIADLKSLAEQIQRVPHLTIEAAANDEKHLYGSVGAVEISKTLKGKNLKVEPDMIKLEGLIKECGLYVVNLALGHDIVAQVQVMIVPTKPEEKK
jgi:large subunit ribosomal protein L9